MRALSVRGLSPYLCERILTMLEINAPLSQLKDLRQRADSLRGYL